MKRICLTLVVAMGLFHPQVVWTQKSAAGTISGQVMNAQTSEPIPGANVLVVGTVLGAATDAQGHFVIQKIDPGRYRLQVTALGFETRTLEVRVAAGETTAVQVKLAETVIPFGEIVVTASKYQQALQEVPVSMSLVKAEELAQRNITSLEEALKYVPGVTVLAGDVNIRGSSGYSQIGSRVLVLLDGVPFMTGDEGDVRWETIPPSEIERIEVMKGAGSALYGSNAIGGVVNIITKKPGEEAQLQVRTYTGLFGNPSYQKWKWTSKRRYFNGAFVDYSGRSEHLEVLASGSRRFSTDFKENGGTKAWNFLGKVGYQASQNARVDIVSGYSDSEDGGFIYWEGLHHPLNDGSDDEVRQTRMRTFESQAYVYPSLTHTVSSRFYYVLRGRWAKSTSEDQEESKLEPPAQPPRKIRGSRARTLGSEVQLNFKHSDQGLLVVGLDGQTDRVHSVQFGDHRDGAYSIYVENEYVFWQKMRTMVGARYDGYEVDGVNRASELNPKFGLTYMPSEATVLRFSGGQGFRAPSVAERFLSTSFPGGVVQPNPGLKPEKSFSVEMGYHRNLFNRATLEVALYRNTYTDFIEPRTLPKEEGSGILVQFRNVQKARIQGVETSLRVDWIKKHLTTSTAYTYVGSKNLSRNPDGTRAPDYGRPLPYRPRHLLYTTTTVRHRFFYGGVDFRFLSRVEEVDRLAKAQIPDLDKQVPVYLTDLRFGVDVRRLSLLFLINNLLQYNYQEYPGSLGPPRNYAVQLNLRL